MKEIYESDRKCNNIQKAGIISMKKQNSMEKNIEHLKQQKI